MNRPEASRSDDETLLLWIAQRVQRVPCAIIAEQSGVNRQMVTARTEAVRKADMAVEGNASHRYW